MEKDIDSTEEKDYKDVFLARELKNAIPSGKYEFPTIEAIDAKPKHLVPFSKITNPNYEIKQGTWVHFYEVDKVFQKMANNPSKYFKFLERCEGVIGMDNSVYRNMPWYMQFRDVAKNREIDYILQNNGFNLIPNVRVGDERTYEFGLVGLPQYSTIAVGALGNIKEKRNFKYFKEGLDFIVKNLFPIRIVFYGIVPEYIVKKYRDMGIDVLMFPTEISKVDWKEV